MELLIHIYHIFRVKLSSLADELNIEFKEVETLLITCILDGQIQGKINQVL